MTLRLAIVTDIHHGLPTLTKCGDRAAGLMQDFASFVAKSEVDRVLDLGDRIIDENYEADLRRSREVARMFEDVPAPIWHLTGNHDRDFLSLAENEAIFGQNMGHEAYDLKGWRILL